MTIELWMEAAIADAERRGLTDLKPLIESLAQSIRALREAEFNEEASGARTGAATSVPRG
jgi:hypothetical protein